MATIKTIYTGNLSTSTTYPISENAIITQANSFGPTDVLTASLSSCIATYIDYIAQKNNFETPNVNVEIKKTMNADGSKVATFDVVINFNKDYTNEQKAIIEDASKTCPVGNSLASEIERTYQFNY
jgi:putative redox protein